MTKRPASRLCQLAAIAVACVTLFATASCRRTPESPYRMFPTPEDAVQGLMAAVKSEKVEELVQLFGPEGKELLESSDPASARQSRQVFTAAAAEKWHLVDREGGGKTLIVGNEEWPFPVPLVREAAGWRFDTPAGREEVIARRIGRNELSVIDACKTYVMAQHLYAKNAHDGKPSGVYAAAFRSDPGKQNGLYWPAPRGAKRSPLGDLLAEAADPARLKGTDGQKPAPFHGYYFRILAGQGASAPGGAKSYVVNGEMTGGFALVAWPAQYDVTGVMTFVVNHEGVVHEKDLGADTETAAKAMTLYDPDGSWIPAK